MMQWTPDKKQQVIQYLKDGLSASQIGSKFDVSRNCIIGLVGRNQDMIDVGFARRPGEQGIRKLRVKSLERKTPTKKSNVFSFSFGEVSQNIGKPLTMLTAFQCHWAVNEADMGQTHLFCGHATRPGEKYCERHAQRSVSQRSTARLAA